MVSGPIAGMVQLITGHLLFKSITPLKSIVMQDGHAGLLYSIAGEIT